MQRTGDGHLVLFHDDDLSRITGVRRLVVKKTGPASGLNPAISVRYAGELIPTLDGDRSRPCQRASFLNIEAKRKLLSDGLEAGIAEAVRRHNLLRPGDRVLI